MRQRTIGLVGAAALLLAFACTTAIDEAASKPAPDSGEGNQVDSRPPAVSRPAESPVADVKAREAASKPARPRQSPRGRVKAREAASKPARPRQSPRGRVKAREAASKPARPRQSPRGRVKAREAASKPARPRQSPRQTWVRAARLGAGQRPSPGRPSRQFLAKVRQPPRNWIRCSPLN